MFLLQIVYPDGTVLRGAPGRANPYERDLIAACKKAILAKGVGIGRTEAQVARAIEEGMTEAILELKRQVRP
jgi:hypothetical protein